MSCDSTKMQKNKVTPKQAQAGGWPRHRVLPPNFRNQLLQTSGDASF